MASLKLNWDRHQAPDLQEINQFEQHKINEPGFFGIVALALYINNR